MMKGARATNAKRRPRSRARHSDAETRDRLLEAGRLLFSEHGFAKVSVRDICREATANVAAVSYHFGDKLGLYEEVMRGGLDMLAAFNATMLNAGPNASAAERLRHYIAKYLPRLVKPLGDDEWLPKLMRHEIREPTAAAQLVFEHAILPRMRFLAGVMAELLDCDEDDPRVGRCVVSVQAQCLFYLPDAFKTAIVPEWPPQSDAAIAAAVEHIVEFSLAGIRAIAAKKT
ncbi:MAG: CerR family C-terminal domain-containing protein [bacterium]